MDPDKTKTTGIRQETRKGSSKRLSYPLTVTQKGRKKGGEELHNDWEKGQVQKRRQNPSK